MQFSRFHKLFCFLNKMTTLIREEATKYILDNYQSLTPQYILDHFIGYKNDSDCIHIFNNLPQDLQKTIDDLAFEKLPELDRQIENVQKHRSEVQKQIQFVDNLNKQLDEDIYQLEHQLENTRELNRQLGI
jgi:peptidoglycan hydrolase CwlO-like protein